MYEFMFTLTPVTVTLFSRPQGRPDALQLPCSYSYGISLVTRVGVRFVSSCVARASEREYNNICSPPVACAKLRSFYTRLLYDEYMKGVSTARTLL